MLGKETWGRNRCRSNEKIVAKEGRQNWDGRLGQRVMLRCGSEKV